MNELHRLCVENMYDTDKFYLGNIHYVAPPQLHSYVEQFYGLILDPIRDSVKNVLEIGVWTGGSHLMWRDYFQNAMIYGLDIVNYPYRDLEDRIVYMKTDAYKLSTTNMFPDNYFDLVVDDGPHTLDSLKFFAKNYSKKVVTNGYLVMEDILNIDWCIELISLLPKNMKNTARVYDLRSITNCEFDVAIVAQN